MVDDYLLKLGRDLHGGVLHLMLLIEIDRLGPIHGYRLIKALSEAASGRATFKEGTIYPILNELERSGIVRSRWGRGASGPQRKYYELTADGRGVLAMGVDEWRRVQTSLDSILNGKRSAKA